MYRIAIFVLFVATTTLIQPSVADAGHVDGINLYRAYFAPRNNVDPSGSLVISLRDRKVGECGTGTAEWSLTPDLVAGDPAKREIQVIQRICFSFAAKKCVNDAKNCCNPVEETTRCSVCIFEKPKRFGPSIRDGWSLPPPEALKRGSCGTIGMWTITAQIKTFPLATATPGAWLRIGTVGLKGAEGICGRVEVDEYMSADETPAWWDDASVIDSHFSYVANFWNCCGPKNASFMIAGSSGIDKTHFEFSESEAVQ